MAIEVVLPRLNSYKKFCIILWELSVLPSSIINQKTGFTVCLITDSITPQRIFSSFLTGIIKIYTSNHSPRIKNISKYTQVIILPGNLRHSIKKLIMIYNCRNYIISLTLRCLVVHWYMIDVFMISSNMAFACVYMLDSRLTPAAPKMREKKE